MNDNYKVCTYALFTDYVIMPVVDESYNLHFQCKDNCDEGYMKTIYDF